MKEYTILDQLKEEFRQYANYICSHYSLRQCFGDRIGQDIAIAKWIYEYFEDEITLENEKVFIQAKKCLKYAQENDLNLFNYLVSNVWANDEGFNFQDSSKMNDFLNDVIEQEELFK